jgi:hypothetical protein
MVKKISISISDELDQTLVSLSNENDVSKSRLIENYLRENPKVIQVLKTKERFCSLCNKEIDEQSVVVNTPRHGPICLDCWMEKQGELVEKHPVYMDKKQK